MEAGNAPQPSDAASPSKAATSNSPILKKRNTVSTWPIIILVFFVLFGFISIGYYQGWKIGLTALVSYAIVTPLVTYFYHKSPFKYKYYYYTIFIVVSTFGPPTYALYKLGGILMILGGYFICLFLLVLGAQQTA